MARARPEDGSAEAELMVHMGEGRLLGAMGVFGWKETRWLRRNQFL